MINNLHIRNYKSIDTLSLRCSRINVLIGEPNAGKSNILEALDLSYLSWLSGSNAQLRNTEIEPINIKEHFRVKKISELFHFGDTSKVISIQHPGFSIGTELRYISEHTNLERKENPKNFFEWTTGSGFTNFDNDFQPMNDASFYSSPIMPYRYKEYIQNHDTGNYLDKLMPPYGNNLINVIKHNPSFQSFISEDLQISQYGIEIIVDTVSNELLILMKINDGLIFRIPYSALADTLKRMIFYTAAIQHSNGYVITFDEPDSLCFPKYVDLLADKIIAQKDRQFFIATHNPYLLNYLIENSTAEELAVHVCGYNKTSGTTAKRLSPEDLSELLDYGVDIFFNINRYLDERAKDSA